MKKITLLKTALFFAGFELTNIAHAALPVGFWQIDNYDFVTKAKISTAFACILSDGTLKAGLSLPFNDWYGNWKRNGDLILLRTNNVNAVSVGASYLVASNTKLMTGYSQSWTTSNTNEGFYTTVVWTFKKTTCP